MIWNDEFLFLHYPKAAGKSLSLAFVKGWETPVKGFVSAGQLADVSPFAKQGSVFWVQGAHQNAEMAAQILVRLGSALQQFRAIFIAIRCPYDLAYSTYKFQRLYASDAGAPPEFARAANSSFEEFVAQFTPSDYRMWFQYQESDLPNLRVIRFESIKSDFKICADEFGFRNPRMPHLNASGGESYVNAITPAIERTIYAKYRFLFERGYYTRLAAASGPAAPEPSQKH